MTRIAAAKGAAIGVLAIASMLVFGTGVASAGGLHTYRCTGGPIPSGTYASVVVAGPCTVDSGAVIRVHGSVVVQKGAMLDAQSAPATITVRGDVIGRAGSMVGLGCQPPEYTGNSGHPCAVDPAGHSTITVKGNVSIHGAIGVFLNGIEVDRNVTVLGGGSEIPWSIKNNAIHGNLTVVGQTSEWIGILFNRIDRNVILAGITLTGTDDSTGTGTNSLFVDRKSTRLKSVLLGSGLSFFELLAGFLGLLRHFFLQQPLAFLQFRLGDRLAFPGLGKAFERDLQRIRRTLVVD